MRFGGLSFAYFAALGLFNPYAPLWMQSLGFSTLTIGGVAALQAWTRIVVPYGWSWLGDHGGQRVRLLRWATGGTVLSAAALLWARDPVAVPIVITLLFAFNGAVMPLSEAAVGRYVGTGEQFDAARYGRMRMWGSIGFIAAVAAGGALLQALGVQAFPVMVLLLNGLLFASAWTLPTGTSAVRQEAPAPPVLARLREPLMLWFFGSIAATVLAHTALYAFFSLYLESFGVDKVRVGLYWALSVICEVAFFAFQGGWFERWTPWRWLQMASLVAALRFALVGWVGQSAVVLVLTQMSHALTFAAHHAACTTLLHRHFPGRLRGRGQALYATLGYGLPGVLGGVGGGWIVEHSGFSAVFGAAAVAGLVGAWCAWCGGRLAQTRGNGTN